MIQAYREHPSKGCYALLFVKYAISNRLLYLKRFPLARKLRMSTDVDSTKLNPREEVRKPDHLLRDLRRSNHLGLIGVHCTEASTNLEV